MCTYLKNMEGKKLKDLKNKYFDSIQKMFDRAFKRKVDEDKDTTELQSLMEVILDEEEVAIDDVPLATKSPKIVDWKIYKEGKKSYYQIVRADRKSQMYMTFSQMLTSFDRKDLEDLYNLVKDRYGSTRLVESIDYLLWNDMKIMFEPHVEDEIYMLVEKRYPLTPPIIIDMYKVNAAERVNAASEEVSIADLEAEQDSGNITKTRSKATPNESSSLGTTSGGGPKCQKTIGDTYAQTRFENELQTSLMIPLPHRRGNILRSDKDRLKLRELMELCTNLQNRVLDLEKTKTTQANEIASLKRRVESSRDEDLGEDASKQERRINAIDADEDITLEVFITGQKENVVEEAVDATQVNTATITTEEITLAQALEALKTSKPKVKGIVFQEPGELQQQNLQQFLHNNHMTRDEANVALTEEWDDIQAKIEADHELAQRLQSRRDVC
ncbi:hypothetical protein Tco_1018942 [Tanacetum coccineum]|uniref:Uncharacterized protein n=1 Tax=Tanacetum coccineum TaxID=301880 RepID=A0ABQ5FY68_9ASTR